MDWGGVDDDVVAHCVTGATAAFVVVVEERDDGHCVTGASLVVVEEERDEDHWVTGGAFDAPLLTKNDWLGVEAVGATTGDDFVPPLLNSDSEELAGLTANENVDGLALDVADDITAPPKREAVGDFSTDAFDGRDTEPSLFSSPQFEMTTDTNGLPVLSSLPCSSIFLASSMFSSTLPNTTCFPSK